MEKRGAAEDGRPRVIGSRRRRPAAGGPARDRVLKRANHLKGWDAKLLGLKLRREAGPCLPGRQNFTIQYFCKGE